MKISKVKVIRFFSIIILLVVIWFAYSKNKKLLCKEVEIKVLDSMECSFVDKNEVLQLIYKVMPDIQGYKLDTVNIAIIDNALKNHPFIRTSSIYKTIDGKLKIELTQRKPLFRVENIKNQVFYVDEDFCIFPTSTESSQYVMMTSGYIREVFDFNQKPFYRLNKTDYPTLWNLFCLARLIRYDSFWRNMIQQIYVTNQKEFELVPIVGNQILQLGSIEDYDKKMFYLKEFYKKGIKKLNWNQYKEISVKYDNQIVCRR